MNTSAGPRGRPGREAPGQFHHRRRARTVVVSPGMNGHLPPARPAAAAAVAKVVVVRPHHDRLVRQRPGPSSTPTTFFSVDLPTLRLHLQARRPARQADALRLQIAVDGLLDIGQGGRGAVFSRPFSTERRRCRAGNLVFTRLRAVKLKSSRPSPSRRWRPR